MRESDTRDAGAGAGACAARRAFPEGATSATLRTTQELLAKHGTRLVLCGLVDPVRAELDRDGIIDLVGTDHVFDTVPDVIAAFGARTT